MTRWRTALACGLILGVASTSEASYKFRGTFGDTIALSSAAFPTTGTICATAKTATWSAHTINIFAIASGGGNIFDFLAYSGSSQLLAGYYNGTDGRVLTGTLPTDAVWNWLCLTFSPSAEKLYLNGAQIGSTNTNDGTWNTATNAKSIGYNSTRAITSDVDAFVGEVSTFNAILDSTTLGHLMTDHQKASCFTTNLISYWPLSADATDAYGSDNGTASGAVVDGDHPTMDGSCPGAAATPKRLLLLGVGN